MKSGENWQVVSEKKTSEDLYNFIHAQSPGARADTVSSREYNFDCKYQVLLLFLL